MSALAPAPADGAAPPAPVSGTQVPPPRPVGPDRQGEPAHVAPVGPAGRRPAAAAPRDGRLQLIRWFAQLYLEVEAGLRPAALLYRIMDPALVARLARRWFRGTGPGRVRRVTGAATGPRRFDAVAVVERGERVGALAIQLRCDELGWRVVEAACPEHPRDAALAGRGPTVTVAP